jgi:hypothetical protein
MIGFCLIYTNCYRPLEVASWFIFTTTQSAMSLPIREVIKLKAHRGLLSDLLIYLIVLRMISRSTKNETLADMTPTRNVVICKHIAKI